MAHGNRGHSLGMLGEPKRARTGDFVFPGSGAGRPLSVMAMEMVLRREMRCQRTGWIAATIKKFDGMGVHVDVNEKQDYAAILYFATNILEKADKVGSLRWCKASVPGLASVLGIQ